MDPYVLALEPENKFEEWRRTIYYCRTKQQLPRDLSFVNRHNLLIGPMATCIGAEYGAMRDSDEVTRDHALVVDGQVAIQHVFSGDDDIQAMFDDACRGHVTVHFNPPKPRRNS
ncbi:MAG: hypothetical protein Q9181_008003 [Wetmoreana brouardii]